MNWTEARERAVPLLDGVIRGRAPAGEPGVELAYLDWGGEGDLIVMHHANGFCAATYAPIAAALRDRYRVVSVDARGHGDSTPVDALADAEAYDWLRMARDYAAALSHILSASGRSGVRLAIGHSFGGILTLAAAAERPGLVEEALLLDPVVLPPPGASSRPAGRGPDLSASARRRRAVYDSQEQAYDHFASRELFKDFRREALALYVTEGMMELDSGEIRLKCHPEAEAAVFDHGGSLDIHSIAASIDVPTQIIHAASGNFSLEVYADLVQTMPNARVESCDAGHLFAMERPELVLALVERILGPND